MAQWCLELGPGRQELCAGTKALASAQLGRRDIFCWSTWSPSCSLFSSDILGLTLGQADVSAQETIFFLFAGVIFCHISELNQPAKGVSCLGFTTDSVSHAVVPRLIGNASKGNVSKILSPGRSSCSYFWEVRMQSLKKSVAFFFFSLHLHSGTSLGQSLEKADNDKCCSWIVARLYTVRSKILSPLLTPGNFLLMMLWADTSVCSLVSMNPAFLLHGFLKSAWE